MPPFTNDTYPLVESYGVWDDHDPRNLDLEGTAGVSGELVEQLAWADGCQWPTEGAVHSRRNVTDTVGRVVALHPGQGIVRELRSSGRESANLRMGV